MGQIVKKKKKGRPAKADPGARDLQSTERDIRRSLRRRSVKYVFDLDDYFDEDEVFVDDEDQRRREKKLKHLLKLQSGGEQESTTPRHRHRHLQHASPSSSEDRCKPSKKRKIDEEMYEDVDEENDVANGGENYNDGYEEEDRYTKREESPPGTPAERPCSLPLPDKKALELILDKLQRKDIYGVYAEPVDPKELPDYHDMIDHPMDFATVRNNLRNGSYATFEQFESDVFLICSNAMQYNAPDTMYHKQARSIQELAKRKFYKLRVSFERNDKDIKPEQKTRTGSISKKQIKRPLNWTGQEHLGSDFSSGATLATVGDIQNVAGALQAVGYEKTCGMDGFVDSSFLNDNNLDKAEGLLRGRTPPSRFGRRSSIIQDDDRRATYNISLSQPVASLESIFSTFDDETKQLMPVGLYSDHSYARSLARFAATLGSVAWKIASKRIEQALPQGLKFGQGWVGEYDPLPTPVSMLENRTVKEPPFFRKVQPASERKLPFFGAGIRSPASIITSQPIKGTMPETKPPFFLSPGIRPSSSHYPSYINQKRGLLESDEKVQKQVESNSPRMLNKNAVDSVGNRQLSRSSKLEASLPMEYSSKKNFSQSGSFRQPDHSNETAFGGFPNGEVISNRLDANTVPSLSSNLTKPASFHPHGQGEGLSDPVQLMRMLADQNQHKPSNQSSNTPQVITSAPSLSRNDPNNAAMAAARAWMSVGAGGLRPATENSNPNKNHSHNPSRNIQSQVRGEFLPNGFVQQGPIQMLVGNQIQFYNQGMVFPQLGPAELSPFPFQASWHIHQQQMHTRQKQESLAPDLNIDFQSSASPRRPSSAVLLDSQQPDLALQL